MYKIKTIPEDFIVKEITNIKLGKGDYSIFLLKKKNYTTIKAIQLIADKLKIKLKRISFAGTKDKKAITEQHISIFKTNIKNLKLKDIKNQRFLGSLRNPKGFQRDISLKYIGESDKPISLGDLKGNEFKIIVRNLDKKRPNNFIKIKIPNYFGKQRFSKNNKEIGKNIIKNKFKEAVNLIIKNDIEYRDIIKDYLKKYKNNYIGALRLIPIKILKLYVHSYQSYLWNLTIEKYLKLNKENIKIPIVGFGTDIKNKEIENIINKILKKEKINFRDFIIRKFPELSLEGTERDLFIDIKNFKHKIIKDKVELTFFLPKSCYATTVVDYLFK